MFHGTVVQRSTGVQTACINNEDAQGRHAEVQYAEFDVHAAPEVLFASTVVGEAQRADGLGRYCGATTSAPGLATAWEREAPINGREVEKALGTQPKAFLCRLWQWVRRKPFLAAAATVLFLGTIGLAAIPVILHHLSVGEVGSDSSRTNPSASAQPASCSSCASPTASTPVLPTSTSLPAHNESQCQNNAMWTTNISYMGVADSSGKTWPYRLLAVPNVTDCCRVCFSGSADGCQGWAFLPWDNTPVPCTIIYGWNSTNGVSKTCPDGRARIEFAEDPGRTGSVGGVGPCGY